LVDENGLKGLLCMFSDNVWCSSPMVVRFGILRQCSNCRHYKRFMRETAEKDVKVMDQIDEIQKHPNRYQELW